MLRIAICDDRRDDLFKLRGLIREYQKMRPGLELEPCFYSCASDVLDAGVLFDIFMLDILMPGLNGIELGRELRTTFPAAPILYLTVSREFALESYRTEAMSYLLKPLDQQAVFHALDQAVERCRTECAGAIAVHVDDGIRRIFFWELIYAEASGRKLCYHTLTGQVNAALRQPTFAQLWEILDGRFLLVRRGCAVNMDCIEFLGDTAVELTGGHQIVIARDRRAAVRQAYLAYCHRRFSAGGAVHA